MLLDTGGATGVGGLGGVALDSEGGGGGRGDERSGPPGGGGGLLAFNAPGKRGLVEGVSGGGGGGGGAKVPAGLGADGGFGWAGC